MSPAQPASPLPLEYAPAPNRARKVLRRAIMVLIVILGPAPAGYHWGPAAWKRVKIQYWQRLCMKYTAPAEQVVYEELPAAANVLLGQPGYSNFGKGTNRSRRFAASHRPIALDTYLNVSGVTGPTTWGDRGQAVVFLGQLRSPSGLRRLVAVTFETGLVGYFTSQPVILPQPDPLTHVDMRWTFPRLFLSTGWNSPAPHLRIFAGQRDPADPSRFTIRYQLWGQEDVIDGRIDDKGIVKLAPRRMPKSPTRPPE